MAKNDKPSTPANDANGKARKEPQLRILRQYVKDLSFENPRAVEREGWGTKKPEIEINMEVSRKHIGEHDYEVALKLIAKATLESDVVFIAEVLYGGLFQVENVPADKLDAVISIEGPRQLFPFARRILADMVRDGGFPSLLLSPVDFSQLYRSAAKKNEEKPQPNSE
ncbi:MAG: protein-export chaperone SecB [Hyphomicrobiales bacterium]|nr:protein-export chaperone SecB [Hyphomicrobiales bacterium]MCY4033865.1 protein-export chaperone SecB [Hyphomicrobiales bacterium]MCY4039138.1 protein-export chaperone SecB [Hyphomicrobiales bacterium]